MRRYNIGWRFDSERHSLSARGIKSKSGQPIHSLSRTRLLPEPPAQFFKRLWRDNEGVFYRGTVGGKGLGFGYMGEGIYLTWDEGMVEAFAGITRAKNHEVVSYKIPKDIKLLDNEGKLMCDIKQRLGVKPWDKVADPVFAKVLSYEVKKLGYDGVISDDKANGIVVFDSSKIEKVKK